MSKYLILILLLFVACNDIYIDQDYGIVKKIEISNSNNSKYLIKMSVQATCGGDGVSEMYMYTNTYYNLGDTVYFCKTKK